MVDAGTGEIVASDLTSRRTHDCARIPVLLEQIDDPVASISADGACDAVGVYEAAQAKGEGRAVRVLIPPGRNARLSPRPSAALKERNRNIGSIRRLGRREWRKRSGYSKRSMVENAIHRYKTIIGRGMRSRTLAGQRVEVQLACGVSTRCPVSGCPTATQWGDSLSGNGGTCAQFRAMQQRPANTRIANPCSAHYPRAQYPLSTPIQTNPYRLLLRARGVDERVLLPFGNRRP